LSDIPADGCGSIAFPASALMGEDRAGGGQEAFLPESTLPRRLRLLKA
jgi:hypothetical protein